jgi:pimeloyl-ACP methyl ester carboxylesterase
MKYTVKGTKKGTIFCIHGNSSSAKIYQEFLESNEILNTKIAIDLNGHGNNQSDDYQINNFLFDSYKKFLLEKIVEIEGDILLIGHSLGGHLAIEIAHDIKNLKGLVIMGTPPVKKPINFEKAFLPVPALNTFFTEYPKEKEITDAINIAVKNKAKRAVIISDFKKANPLVRKPLAVNLIENQLLNQFHVFTKLNIPKYIIAGDSDPFVNRDYLEYVKNNSEYSCRIFDIKNCGHYPSIDKPREFINIIKEITKEVF